MTLRRILLRWYSKAKRDLPWRRTRDPYAIWVSEIMLQQTRVETVLPFYERFLRRFPNVGSLSRAREAAVLGAWSGLGYYRRARNLHAAARDVTRLHGGRFPRDRESLLKLPGIGDYTAAAIASIAFGRSAAAVDGNVIRVLARIAGLRGRRDAPALRREVTKRAEALARGPKPGDWTQAMMELGAVVCLPREPLCHRCPVAKLCLARRSGHPARYPEAQRARPPREEKRLLLLIRSGTRILLVPDDGDEGATWTVPYTRLDSVPASRAARTLAARYFGAPAKPAGPSDTFRHRTFSHALTYEVWSLHVAPEQGNLKARKTRAVHAPRVWASPRDLLRLPVRAHTLKAATAETSPVRPA